MWLTIEYYGERVQLIAAAEGEDLRLPAVLQNRNWEGVEEPWRLLSIMLQTEKQVWPFKAPSDIHGTPVPISPISPSMDSL